MYLPDLGLSVWRHGLRHGDSSGLGLAQEGVVVDGGYGPDVGGGWDAHCRLREVGARTDEFSVTVRFDEDGSDAGVEYGLAFLVYAGAIGAA